MKTEEKLTELKNLIMMSYDAINNMITESECIKTRVYLQNALNLVDELAVVNKAELKLSCLIDAAVIVLQDSIKMSYDAINNTVADFEDTETHAYLLSALDLVDEL